MTYPAFITDFLRDAQLPRLSAHEPPPDKRLIQRIAAAGDHEIAAANDSETKCIRSLLFLVAGGIEQAHGIVQELSTSGAAYVHGMIHRIDDDFDNARYWFRRAGHGPATAEMYRRAAANSLTITSHPIWDPILLTDMLEASRTSRVTDEMRTILTIEYEVLLQFGTDPSASRE
jgi:hypothetical protein